MASDKDSEAICPWWTCRACPVEFGLWRIWHLVSNGAYRHHYSFRISATPSYVLRSFFSPPSREKFLTSPAPMPPGLGPPAISGRSEATVSVSRDEVPDPRSCVGCAGLFCSWCFTTPLRATDPHRDSEKERVLKKDFGNPIFSITRSDFVVQNVLCAR